MLDRLRAGELEDDAFDALYPEPMRSVARRFWTPLPVARRAAEHIAELGVDRVLDVGSGCGKFCIAAAAIAPSTEFVGIEQRPHLVAAAIAVSARIGVSNVRFAHGDVAEASAEGIGAFYFFNPFAENGFSDENCYDSTVELSHRRMIADLLRIERMLANAPVGTLVLTYHGFGGRLPDSYDVVSGERAGTDWLRIFRKTRSVATPGRYLVEVENRIAIARVRRPR